MFVLDAATAIAQGTRVAFRHDLAAFLVLFATVESPIDLAFEPIDQFPDSRVIRSRSQAVLVSLFRITSG
jgi:hypothetical protein